MQELLVASDLDALLVVANSARDPDLAPFVGSAHLGESLLVVPRVGAVQLGFWSPMERDEAASTGLELLSPEVLEIGRWARELLAAESMLARVLATALQKLAPRSRVALAGHPAAGTLHQACQRLGGEGWRFVDGSGLLRRARKKKSEDEIEAIRLAASGTVEAMRRVAELLAAATADHAGELWMHGERLRVARLRAEIAQVFARYGLEQPEGNLLACAGDAGVPHNQGSNERVVRHCEAVLVDLFPKGRLFADCTRTFCVGQPAESLLRAHATVLATLREAHAQTRAGVRGWDLQEQTCATFDAAGYATPLTSPGTTVGYVHGLGHGVGYELHEEPSFRKEAGGEGTFEVGDVLTLEPGLYDPNPQGGYGIRLEDLVWLGPDGAESLTPLPYDLDPKSW
ncbi:MAG: Xaa-Pro peptidase family protein [Acidobacteriota bacterium]